MLGLKLTGDSLTIHLYFRYKHTHTHTRTLEQWVFTRLSGSPAWVQGIFITWQASLWGNWVGNPAILMGIPNTSQVISLSCSVSLDEHPLNSYLKSWSPGLAALELCYEIVQEGRTCSLWSLVPVALPLQSGLHFLESRAALSHFSWRLCLKHPARMENC